MNRTLLFFFLIYSLCFAYGQDINELKKQADAGSSEAQYQLGDWLCHHDQCNYGLGLNYLRLAAKSGNTDATNRINHLTKNNNDQWGHFELYYYGSYGLLNDEQERILLDYCSKGDASAYIGLAFSYLEKNDYKAAFNYFEKSLFCIKEDNFPFLIDYNLTELDDTPRLLLSAYSFMGWFYEKGLVVPKDIDMAIAYYQIYDGYCSDTHINALIDKILDKYNNPFPLKNFHDEYSGYWIQLSITPLPDSQADRALQKIGVLYMEKGNYDHIICVELPSKIDDNNYVLSSPIAYLWTGELYFKGIGVTQDYNKAFANYNAVVSNELLDARYNILQYYPDIYRDACYRLYECYLHGYGVQKNQVTARKYFNEALKYGCKKALSDDQKRYEILNNTSVIF